MSNTNANTDQKEQDMAATENTSGNGKSSKRLQPEAVAVALTTEAGAATEVAAAMPAGPVHVIADDAATQELLERAERVGVSDASQSAEVLAGRISAATGIPLRASNMVERLTKAAAEGRITAEKLLEVFGIQADAQIAAAEAVPLAVVSPLAPAPAPASAAAPIAPQVAPVLMPVATPAAAVAPAGARTFFRGAVGPLVAKPVELDPVMAAVADLNRRRARPPATHFTMPSEGTAQRIMLSLDYRGGSRDRGDVMIGGMSEVVVVGTLPPEMDSQMMLLDLRRIQLHPFALDRMLVSSVKIDGVEIASATPATTYARPDGSPTGTLSKKSSVEVRVRNLTTGIIPLAMAMLAVPYEMVDGQVSG